MSSFFSKVFSSPVASVGLGLVGGAGLASLAGAFVPSGGDKNFSPKNDNVSGFIQSKLAGLNSVDALQNEIGVQTGRLNKMQSGAGYTDHQKNIIADPTNQDGIPATQQLISALQSKLAGINYPTSPSPSGAVLPVGSANTTPQPVGTSLTNPVAGLFSGSAFTYIAIGLLALIVFYFIRKK